MMQLNDLLDNESDALSFHATLPASFQLPVSSKNNLYTESFLLARKRLKGLGKYKPQDAEPSTIILSPEIATSPQSSIIEIAPPITLNMDIFLTESIVCVQRGSKIESFDVEGHKLQTLKLLLSF